MQTANGKNYLFVSPISAIRTAAREKNAFLLELVFHWNSIERSPEPVKLIFLFIFRGNNFPTRFPSAGAQLTATASLEIALIAFIWRRSWVNEPNRLFGSRRPEYAEKERETETGRVQSGIPDTRVVIDDDFTKKVQAKNEIANAKAISLMVLFY